MSGTALTLVDQWTLAAAVLASAALALRSNMLRPAFRHLVDAPTLVWLSLSLLSIACAGFAWTILGGFHALPRDAAVMSALAVSSVVLLLNLRHQLHGTRSAKGEREREGG